MNNDLLDELSKKLAALLPSARPGEAESAVRGLLQQYLAKLDLVTREEFDVQTALLQRSREKLEALETRLDQLAAGSTAAASDDDRP